MSKKKYRSFKDGIERAMTLNEVATEMGISHERARQLEVGALSKVRKVLFDKYGDSIKLHDIIPSLIGKGDYDESLSLL